jgi:hypothetical protein
MVFWPCLLKLTGDDELIYLKDNTDFISECRELIFSDDDLVIDSQGCSYFIQPTPLKLVNNERLFSTQEVTDLIREHEFSKAQVCLTKIYFTSIAEAVKSLDYVY